MTPNEFQKFMDRVDVENIETGNDCWNWKGAMSGTDGYGVLRINGKTTRASRLAYEHWHGVIPDESVIHHACNNPPCVNPNHLKALPQRRHVLVGNGPTAINARKTHCKRGHKFTKETTYFYKDKPGKECKICKDEAYWQKGIHRTKPFTSKFRGVSWNKRRDKWQAQLSFQGKYYWLGCFASESDAQSAANEKFKRLYGFVPSLRRRH